MSRRRDRVIGIGAVAIALAGTVAWSSADEDPGWVRASLRELNANPRTFMDRRVVVSGQVTDVIGRGGSMQPGSPRAAGFTIGHERPLLVMGVDLLDMSGPRGRDGIDEGEVVQVSGRLRRFTRDEVGDQVGVLLDDDLFRRWAGRPVIVGSKIDVVRVEKPATRIAHVAVADLEAAPRSFDGRRVRLENAVVTAPIQPAAVALGEHVMLVAPPGRLRQLVAGDQVDVTGQIFALPPSTALADGGTALTRRLVREHGLQVHQLRRFDAVLVAEYVSRPGHSR